MLRTSLQSEAKCKAVHVKISFICVKTNFLYKNYKRGLTFLMRFKATREWSIKMSIIKVCFLQVCLAGFLSGVQRIRQNPSSKTQPHPQRIQPLVHQADHKVTSCLMAALRSLKVKNMNQNTQFHVPPTFNFFQLHVPFHIRCFSQLFFTLHWNFCQELLLSFNKYSFNKYSRKRLLRRLANLYCELNGIIYVTLCKSTVQ